MANPKPLSRDELAQFLPSQRAIRAFEEIFTLVAPVGDSSLQVQIDQVNLDASNAQSSANSALRLISALEHIAALAASNPAPKHNTKPMLDYIDLCPYAPHEAAPARLTWNGDDDTLNLHHTGGVTQQVGEEIYLRGINHTGSTIANGACVGFAGVNGAIAIEFEPFIADGSMPSLYAIGVATQSIADDARGRATVWGRVRAIDTTGTPYGETWAVGDILYASTATAGGLTNIKPTAPSVIVPMAAVLSVDATNGEIFVRPTIEQQQYYGTFFKITNQSPAVANTAYGITFDSSANANGVSIGAPASRIVVANSGLYVFGANFQLSSGSASVKNVWLWFRKNGVDVPNSSLKVSLESNTALATPSRSTFFSLEANDYIELMWAADDTNATLDAIAATGFAPAAPACELIVNQIQQ